MASLKFNVIALLILISSVANAQKLTSSSESGETDFWLSVTRALDPSALSVQDIFTSVPSSQNYKDISPECDPKFFEDSVLAKKKNTPEYFKALKEYFSECQLELSQRSPKGALSLARMALDEYYFLQHPQVKKFVITLNNGTKVPAIMALKQDPTPRPLVILKCGVFCGATQSPMMKNYLIQLFDQAPFNVVLLANQTGMDYLYANSSLSLGGWGEGFESLQVGKWLREKWEYRERISSVHLMGMSLGGNAAVFGASYNDLYPMEDGKKVFSSVVAICPVMTLKPTLEVLYNDNTVGTVFTEMTKSQFRGARDHLTDIPDLLTDDKFPKKSGMPDYLGSLASTSLQRRGIASTPASYFKNNNFWNLTHRIETPMLVWASKDDIVVSNKLNAQVMEKDEYYQNAPNVAVLNLNYGSHCAFSSAYGYQAASVVLRTFVLAHSPEFVDHYKRVEVPWTFGFSKLNSIFVHVGQTWKFEAKSDKAKVTFRIFNWRATDACFVEGPWGETGKCVNERSYDIPIASLKVFGGRIPRNEVEAQVLTREFNSKVEFLSKGQPLNGTSNSEFVMSARNLWE
ncbi:MAG: hypothetical protein J7501_08810 [Bdellovibrio sp.]|nr:hypothetical protein [Bdellovibrio sp.]